MLVFLLFLFVSFCFWCCLVSAGFDCYLDRCGLDFSEFSLMLDGVSVICLVMLFFCGSVALGFCGHYFVGDRWGGASLFFMLFIFLSVMALLVCSYGLLFSLVMWEYLGVVSFFLILFYGNCESLRATLVTLFASRFGDVCFFGLIFFFYVYWGGSVWFLSFLLLLVVLTKSACFPFVSWLLEAMRAPTPVSSLVHSSTLVAAGVWFLFRYGDGFIPLSFEAEFVLFILSLSTILISSLCSVVFLDLKKIVALSTCNNVSWCIVFFLFGDSTMGLFQLLSHGVAKCYLFIVLGDLMSGSSSAQDARGVYGSVASGALSPVLQGVLVLSLCGLPFLGVFFSKHGLLCEYLWSYSTGGGVLIVLSLFMSFVYSFRFWCLLCGPSSLGVFSYGSLFFVLFILSLLGGVMNFLFVGGCEESCLINCYWSCLFLLFQLLGAFVGVYLYYSPVIGGLSFFGSVVWGADCLVSSFYSICASLRSLFLFFLYRWEVDVLGHFSSLILSLGSFSTPGWSSLKFLVFSGLCVFGACVVLS